MRWRSKRARRASDPCPPPDVDGGREEPWITSKLWYWSGIPERGEFVRLTLEAGGIGYVDQAVVAGDDALMKDMKARVPEPFAPPYLITDDLVIAQVANILLHLGDTHGLAPKGEADRHFVLQAQLTIADMTAEAHGTHQPVAVIEHYEDQKKEAARKAADFRANRTPRSSASSSAHWPDRTEIGWAATCGAMPISHCSIWSKGCASPSPGGWRRWRTITRN